MWYPSLMDHDFDPDNLPTPTRLIETIDTIRNLRTAADLVLERDNYDPCGYTAMRAKVFRDHADKLEVELERRVGWT